MEMQKLSQEMKKIEMPEEMKKRIIENCKQATDEISLSVVSVAEQPLVMSGDWLCEFTCE